MAIKERTIYPLFYSEYSQQELESIFGVTPSDQLWVYSISKNTKTQMGYLLFLKLFRHLGYFPKFLDIPSSIITYFQGQFEERFPHQGYSNRQIIRIQQHIRKYLNIKLFSEGGDDLVRALLLEIVQGMADPADLVNASIEHLQHNHFALPSYDKLLRLVRTVRKEIHQSIFDKINNAIEEKVAIKLDELLVVENNTSISKFSKIKEHPGPARLTEIKDWVERWVWLDEIADLDFLLKDLRFTKIEIFASQAYAMELSDVKQVQNDGHRYLLLLCLIYIVKRRTKDELTEMFIRRIRKTHSKAKSKLERIKEDQKELEELIVKIFSQIVKDAKTETDNGVLGEKVKDLLEQKGGMDYFDSCTSVLNKSHGNNYLPLLWKFYVPYRKTLLDLIEVLKISSATDDNLVLKCWRDYLPFRNYHRKYIEEVEFDLTFLSQKWRSEIVYVNKGVIHYDRQLLELALLTQLAEGLQTTDFFVSGSLKYGDYRVHMISKEECSIIIPEFCSHIGIESTIAGFIAEQEKELREAITSFQDGLGDEALYRIDKFGKVRLQRKKRILPSKSLIKFQDQVRSRMETVNLLDILHQGNQWTQYINHFHLNSGNQAKSTHNNLHQIYTLFAFGTNLGPYQTAKHTQQPISRRVMEKMNQQQIDAEKLQNGIAQLINHFQAFELPRLWGKSESAVADGTHISLSENNLSGERHIRYGGYGGIAYHHISDTYIALFSKFIACGTWEAVYILDGLLNHKSNADIKNIHADTQGQNEPAFGLSYLLGIELMPRIRNSKQLTLYKAYEQDHYKQLENTFKKSIDWKLIETHWLDMMQVAISIGQGKILPSTILQKLGIHGRKTKLYKAFRELGRVRRTIFLCNYFRNNQVRETIHQATTKIESYNSFCDWITFGGEKIITGDPIEQEKRVRYTTLIANNIMLHNVQQLTRIIKEMNSENSDINEEMIKSLSPYMTDHIRRFGDFVLNLEKAVEPLNYKI